MQEDQWWGYSKQHDGWVVLDRTRPCNMPESHRSLVFIICKNWVEFSEERKNWEPPDYIYALNYIEQLNGETAKHAKELYEKLRKEWSSRKKRLLDEKQEKERAEREEKLIAEKNNRLNIKQIFLRNGISNLWHITHKNNIGNILEYGILNHYDAHKSNANRVDISDHDAQRWRENIDPHYHRRIHEYAPLYINPRNPMLSVRRDLQNELCIVEVSLSAILDSEFLISDGNAASSDTKFISPAEYVDIVPWDVLRGKFWTEYNDGKRKMCAEVLIYPKVTPAYIGTVHCYSRNTLETIVDFDCNVELSHNLFF